MSGPALVDNSPPTETRILEVASRLFYERGYHATTMRDLAAGVGIKAASLYNHFPSKQEILVRICLDGVREFYEGAIARLDGLQDVCERLRTLIVWHVIFEIRSQYMARVADAQLDALNPRSRQEVIEARDGYDRLLAGILADGQDQDLWQLDNPGIIRLAIATMCNGVNVWHRDGGRLEPDEIGHLYATFILNALRGYEPSR